MTEAQARAALDNLPPPPPKPSAEEKFERRKLEAYAIRQRDAKAQYRQYVLVSYDRATGVVSMHRDDFPQAVRYVNLKTDECDCKDRSVPAKFGITCRHPLMVALMLEDDPDCLNRLPEPTIPPPDGDGSDPRED